MRHASRSPLLALAALLVAGCQEATQPTFPEVTPRAQTAQLAVGSPDYDIVDLGAFGGDLSSAVAVTDPGVVYGRYRPAPGVIRSFRWSGEEGMADLGDFDGLPFRVFGANNRGDYVGLVVGGPGTARPVAWLRGTGFVYLDDADHRGQAWDINEQGEVVGARAPAGGGSNVPFIWSAKKGLRTIPIPGPGAQAFAINNAGQVVGSTGVDGSCCNQGFIWSEHGGMTLIPNLGGWAFALDVNDRGEVVGESGLTPPQPGMSRGGPGNPGQLETHAFYWSKATGTVDLGTLGGHQSVAWAIDQHGAVFGWSRLAGGGTVAMRWTEQTGMVLIPTPGYRYAEIFSVNHKGVAVGEAGPGPAPTLPGHAVMFVPR